MAQVDSENSTAMPARFAGTSALTPIPGLDWLDIKEDTPPAEIFRAIGRLRKEARDEIDRLIRFLDESDGHMELEPSLGFPERHYDQSGLEEIEDGHIGSTNDCEVDGDEEDASYPEGGCRGLEHPHEDDEDDDPGEDDGTGEWSLGFLERSASLYGPAWGRDCSGDQSGNIRCQGLGADLEDEHDGAEPDVDQEHDAADDEPSLGWTIDGVIGNTDNRTCDLEQGEPARAPQDRAERLEQTVTTDTGVCRRRILGLSQSQREAVKERKVEGCGVSLVGGPEWGMP